jgi:hypothetical protein
MMILCFLAAAIARRTAAFEIGASESLLEESASSEGGEGVFKQFSISARTTNRLWANRTAAAAASRTARRLLAPSLSPLLQYSDPARRLAPSLSPLLLSSELSLSLRSAGQSNTPSLSPLLLSSELSLSLLSAGQSNKSVPGQLESELG